MRLPTFLLIGLVLLWIALRLAMVAEPYCFEWDSAQYALGAKDFDIARHQPHPPGYPLWVMATRALGAITGEYLHSQRVLALLFAVAAVLFSWRMAVPMLGEERARWAAALLALSPVVQLYSAVPLTYIVDLFASASVGYAMLRAWRGDRRWFLYGCLLLAICAGFRQSGATFLLPMVGWVAWCLLQQRRWRELLAGAAGGMVAALAWYVPTALDAGGFGVLAALNRNQLLSTAAGLSVFFGASPADHVKMALGLVFYSAFALGVPLALYVLSVFRRERRAGVWPPSLFFFLWVAPNLAFNLLVHNTKSGYLLLSVPPLVLLLTAELPHRWTAGGAVASLALSYLPFLTIGWLVSVDVPLVAPFYHMLRCTPRISAHTAEVNQQLGAALKPHEGRIQYGYVLRSYQEAPNLRTIPYDFPAFEWKDGLRESPAANECAVIVEPTAFWEGPLPEPFRKLPYTRRVWLGPRGALWVYEPPNGGC